MALLGGTWLRLLTADMLTAPICSPANTDPAMRLNDDEFLDVCQNVEAGLKIQYERNPALTEERCAFALDQAKIAMKQRFGCARNESCKVGPDQQGIIDGCVECPATRVDNANGSTHHVVLQSLAVESTMAFITAHSCAEPVGGARSCQC